jgi:23S rRNA (pseudouridine1915-N3)-methyltransferase
MKVTILAVGSLTTPGMKILSDDYLGRIQHYSTVTVQEIKEGKGNEEQVLTQEAEQIKRWIPNNAKVIVLSIEGTLLSSEGLSSIIEDHKTYDSSPLVFIIGGSTGLDSSIKSLGKNISMSKMTFPHQLARVVLLEQLYRAFKILNNEVYHK